MENVQKDVLEDVQKEWEGQLFGIESSTRYHSKRADFFGFLTKLVTAISMIAGSGVVATATYDAKYIPTLLGVIVAIISAISLTFGYSSREQLHNKLKRKFTELHKSMVKCEKQDRETLSKKIAERLTIENDEPAAVRTLSMMCYNELKTAKGHEERADIGWFRSFFCQIDLPFLKPKLAEKQDKNMSGLYIIFAISFTIIFLVLSYMFLPGLLPESFLIKFMGLYFIIRIAFLLSIIFIVTCFFIWTFCKIGKAINNSAKLKQTANLEKKPDVCAQP
jgi:cellulose synthase/poly-beta-1,6-N-acetylglucosamine synthase-like glycosyltransferase